MRDRSVSIPGLTAICLTHDAELVREDGHWHCPVCFADFGNRDYPSPVAFGYVKGFRNGCRRLRDRADCGHYGNDPRRRRPDHVAGLGRG
jgi:hypothetical protein